MRTPVEVGAGLTVDAQQKRRDRTFGQSDDESDAIPLLDQGVSETDPRPG
jgi:hypothetical protein